MKTMLRALRIAIRDTYRALRPTPAPAPLPTAHEWHISSADLVTAHLDDPRRTINDGPCPQWFPGDTCLLEDGTVGAAIHGPWGAIIGDPDALHLLAESLHLLATTAEFAQQLQYTDTPGGTTA